MRGQWRYLMGGTGVAVGLLSFVICLEVQIATAQPRVEAITIVHRALKGDRLPSVPRPSVTPAPQPRLLEGCESSVSVIRNPKAREVIGRCMAAAPAQPGSVA